MIGRDGVDEAVAQAVPEHGLVARVSSGGDITYFAPSKSGFRVGSVERQVLNQRLDADAHAALTGGDGFGRAPLHERWTM